MNPLAAILGVPVAASAVGSAVQAAGGLAADFAGALSAALERNASGEDAGDGDAGAGSDVAGQRQALAAIANELGFELAQLAEAVGATTDPSPRFRVNLADGQIDVLADDLALESALERMLADRPDLVERLRDVAVLSCPTEGDGDCVEMSLDSYGELSIQLA